MMRLRFSTVQEVFDALPTLRDDMEAEPTNEAPVPYLQRLGDSRTPEDGIAFCAYVLGRREAVWWACQCVRLLLPGAAEFKGLQAAEAWVRDPEEEQRLAALACATGGDRRCPTTWLALAAGWSGGNIARPGHGTVMAAPHYTAKAVRVAILGGLSRVVARERAACLRQCLEGGVRLMQAP